jgi:hypothetical protein
MKKSPLSSLHQTLNHGEVEVDMTGPFFQQCRQRLAGYENKLPRAKSSYKATVVEQVSPASQCILSHSKELLARARHHTGTIQLKKQTMYDTVVPCSQAKCTGQVRRPGSSYPMPLPRSFYDTSDTQNTLF